MRQINRVLVGLAVALLSPAGVAGVTTFGGYGTVSFPTSCAAAVQLLANRTRGTGGLILLDKNGNPGFAFNTPRMAYGFVNADASFITAV